MIVGILNITPDSFYDGGQWFGHDEALQRGIRLAQDGADIIDVGGESTRPFAEPVLEQDEIDRTVPVIRDLVRQGLAVSIDTTKSGVAAAALEAGACIVNDISACAFDPELLDVLVQHKPGYVLMHCQGRPQDMQRKPCYDNVVPEILEFFEDRLNMLVRAGVPEERIVIDPGIGFGKLLEHNLAILRNIASFRRLGRPVYLGLSNKSMWEKLLGLPLGERQNATQVATALTARSGVRIHRVHDTGLTRQTLTVVQALGGLGGTSCHCD